MSRRLFKNKEKRRRPVRKCAETSAAIRKQREAPAAGSKMCRNAVRYPKTGGNAAAGGPPAMKTGIKQINMRILLGIRSHLCYDTDGAAQGERMHMANRKVYLVDTENIGSAWKELLPQKGSKDMLLLFYTENSPGISYADLDAIRQYPSSFEAIECFPGKNGLDFQLVSYLGYLIKSAPKTDYVIVTNDTGYDAVVRFWTNRSLSVIRKTKSELTIPEKTEETDVLGEIKASLKGLLPEEYSDEAYVEGIFKIICDYDAKQLQALYQTLQKEYGQEAGSEIYRRIKPKLREMYKKIPK